MTDMTNAEHPAPKVRKPRRKDPNMPLPGPVSLFRNKVRAPVSLTLTTTHHEMVMRAARRLGLTRADTIALLIDQYADTVQRPARVAHETPA